MGNSSGTSHARRLRPPDLWCRIAWLAAACWVLPAAFAQTPEYAKTALAHFDPNPPARWAYTLETNRNEQSMVERFDPSRPPGGQWTLLRLQDRPPTADELEKYARSRPVAGSGGSQANFQKDDIEPGSLKLIEENETRATFAAAFREQSSGPDKMLGHLDVILTINKTPAYIEGYVLQLKEPYWPVLGVKMNQLRIEARFSAPAGDRPSLPLNVESRFTGRILLVSNEEKLRLIYSEFSQTPR
jgi:hypothetical protein